jgi:uncharacterized protein YacL
MKRLWQVIMAVAGGVAGNQLAGVSAATQFMPWEGMAYGLAAAGAVLGLAVGSYGMNIMERAMNRMEQRPSLELIAGIVGLLAGLAISALLFPVLSSIGTGGLWICVLLTLLLGSVGYRLGTRKKDEMMELLHYQRPEEEDPAALTRDHKILDTSVIIDGRIADICKTGFVEGTLVIPEFVLEELQHIADSSDLLKRNRGRRGLDILNKIQKELDVKVLIYEGDFEEISEVDSKLVKLAKVLQGKVVTNDFNLNKVCELQGVAVLNINDLANSVKPVVLPGEEIPVHVIKDGKEFGQGVAYLDDGTMIVVEGGREYIGTTIEVLVTSVLQTSAGRMIFAKPKLLERAL